MNTARIVSLPAPEPKRRKVSKDEIVRPVTPLSPLPATLEVVDEIDEVMEDAPCPCGHLHGQGEHQDISAVGFTSISLMRGPD